MYHKIENLASKTVKFISLKEAKQYLRIEHELDDGLIENMLHMVCVAAENYLGLKLQENSWKMTIYNYLPYEIKFLHRPVTKIEQIKLIKSNGEESFLNIDQYHLNQASDRVSIKRQYMVQKAEIIYQTGYKLADLPSPIIQGMLEHLAIVYDFRGSDRALPMAAKSLYHPYKQLRF